MPDLTASRTLVKSHPELWTECSDAGSLSRHLDGFGDIRITRLEPESAVAWEGEHARGTVTLEPSGWGTRVVLTATPAADKEPEPEVPAPEPVALEAARPGFWARLFGRWQREASVADEPVAAPAPESTAAEAASDPQAALVAALDSLGQAHHRPFSRA
jgi:hypothetical protein